MGLILSNPTLAYRSCDDCGKYIYGEDGLKRERGGVLLERPKNIPPPCHNCPKLEDIEPKNPENGRKYGTLSEKNWHTLELYFQQKAGISCKIDAITARNFGIIEQLIFHSQNQSARLQTELMKISLSHGTRSCK